MTISRDRWQHHLKTRGDHYHAAARELEALHERRPEVGASIAAMAHHALAELLEACRVARLTRNQHVMFRLGALEARVEGCAALARRAARAADGALPPKAGKRLSAPALAVMSRVGAREVARETVAEAVRLVVGAGAGDATFADRLGRPAVDAAQAGLLEDLDAAADHLYGRVAR